jgi:hypothetical protein
VGVIDNMLAGTKFTRYRNAASQLVESQATDADISNFGYQQYHVDFKDDLRYKQLVNLANP